MHRTRFVSGLAIAAFVGVLVTSGCVSAATNSPPAAATASACCAPRASQTSASLATWWCSTFG